MALVFEAKEEWRMIFEIRSSTALGIGAVPEPSNRCKGGHIPATSSAADHPAARCRQLQPLSTRAGSSTEPAPVKRCPPSSSSAVSACM